MTLSSHTHTSNRNRARKYLDFLNCTGESSFSLPLSGSSPQYRINIYKQPSVSGSSAEVAAAATMFYLESGSSDTEDADVMQNLLKQEDERGEKHEKRNCDIACAA